MYSPNIRSIIIGDALLSSSILQDKLETYYPEVTIIGTAINGKSGIQLIKATPPDLLFLDIELADMTGFTMLSALENINFQTIFITSSRHYAIEAIRFNALDYLVRPIDLEELQQAIQRYKKQKIRTPSPPNIKHTLKPHQAFNSTQRRLILHTHDGELQIILEHILYIEGERNYSYIYLINGKKKLVTKTLSDIITLLGNKEFYRCHRSFIINRRHIIKFNNRTSLMLSNGSIIPVARRRKDGFTQWLYEREVI